MKKLSAFIALLAVVMVFIPIYHASALRSCIDDDPGGNAFSLGYDAGCDQAFNFGEFSVNEFCVRGRAPNSIPDAEKQDWANGCFDGYEDGQTAYEANLNTWPIKGLNTDNICSSLSGFKNLVAQFQKDNYLAGCVRGYNFVVNHLSSQPNGQPFFNKSAGGSFCTNSALGQLNQENGCSDGLARAQKDYQDSITPKPDDTVSPDTGTPAAPGDTGKKDATNEIDSVEDVLLVIDRLTNWLFTIFIAAAVIMVLIAAFKYLTSGGGEETAKAHKMILYAAVAIAVALLAKGVVNVVQSIVSV